MRMVSTKALTLSVAVVLTIAAVTVHAQECGKLTDGMECPNNVCCSWYGTCGLDVDHCGNGCQSGACYKSRRCGTQADTNSTTCPNNHCCSGDGYCGYGEEYCGNGCQNGPCRANIACSAGKACLNNYCCSKFGYCGIGVQFCGEGCQSGACHAAVAAP